MQAVPKKYQVLVVDDIADNQLLLKTFLELEGYSVDVADTASLALEKMHASLPDLVLLDVMMPNIDGFELTRKIRRDDKLRSLPVVLITAHSEVCRIKGLAVGATDFVRKPFNLKTLLLTIENLIAARAKKRD